MSMDEVLDEEQLSIYEDRLYTVEDVETGEQYLCGIWLGENNLLMQDGYYFSPTLVGVPYTATHVELAADMITYLLEQE